MWFTLAVAAAAVLAGTVASVAGFGIGSLLINVSETDASYSRRYGM